MSNIDPQGGAGNPDEPTERELEMFRRFFTHPYYIDQIAPQWVPWLISRIEVGNLSIPISQVLGFTQFQAQPAVRIDTEETTTTTSPTDLATVGPELTGLPDGRYIVLWGCIFNISVAGGGARMGVKVNSTEPTVDESAQTGVANFTQGARAITTTLSNGGNNTLRARYWVSSVTGTFGRRWLIALRYANA